GPLLRRVDVLTREVPNAVDLREFLMQTADPAARQAVWRATAHLLQRLSALGLWHPDLNAKNVLVTAELAAAVIDIDRMRLVVPGDPQCAAANLDRLLRSLRKTASSREQERELAQFAEMVRASPPVPESPAATA
ncbi:MAG TPA: lipopolysaccharide kinase InaA family protein, partial [Gemmatimonadaceae bacterium]|nr:lipopolysaccharide kinase InaA family protein [Gemmatimonadaceae bacterium]